MGGSGHTSWNFGVVGEVWDGVGGLLQLRVGWGVLRHREWFEIFLI